MRVVAIAKLSFFCSVSLDHRAGFFIDAWFLQSHEDIEKTEIDKDHMLALDSLHTGREEKKERMT